MTGWTNSPPEERGRHVLAEIDRILAWEAGMEREKDGRFVELGTYLCEVRQQQYWRLEGLESFEAFLETRFPGSRRKAYYLMSIHETLPAEAKPELRQIGWSKSIDLMRVARVEKEKFPCATWLHMARTSPKEKFHQMVEDHLTAGGHEPTELLFIRMYKSQWTVVEDAVAAAQKMLESGATRGAALELICADFLAGLAADHQDPEGLIAEIARLCRMVPEEWRDRGRELAEAAP